jgi:hypothetical protein
MNRVNNQPKSTRRPQPRLNGQGPEIDMYGRVVAGMNPPMRMVRQTLTRGIDAPRHKCIEGVIMVAKVAGLVP